MTDNKKCKCPLCEQQFMPENGLTAEEHLARGIINVFRDRQNVDYSPKLPCPRCGHKRMAPELEQNALSRHADVHICDICGADEAVRAMNKNTLPSVAWYAVSEILKCVRGVKCEKYIPEKNNPYPLCDNPACKEAEGCNISAHMADSCGYDK